MKASDRALPRVRPRCPQRLALMQAAKQFGIWHGKLMIAMAKNGELSYERDGDELFTTAAACEEYRRRHSPPPAFVPS